MKKKDSYDITHIELLFNYLDNSLLFFFNTIKIFLFTVK